MREKVMHPAAFNLPMKVRRSRCPAKINFRAANPEVVRCGIKIHFEENCMVGLHIEHASIESSHVYVLMSR